MSRYYKFGVFGTLLTFLTFIVILQAIASPVDASSFPSPTPNGSLSAKEALDKGLITLTLTGNGQLFYHNPIHYVIQNLTSNLQQIYFPVGQLFIPMDVAYQAFVLVNTVHLDINFGQVVPNQLVVVDLSLAPGQTIEGDLPAFCINESKHAPSSGNDYQLGGMATGDLFKLAQVIESQSAKGHLGAQLAVWSLTDKLNLDDFTAKPLTGEPSLIDTIQPILCLAQDEIDLGQQLLVDAKVTERLYTGVNPITSYCQNQGIPSISQAEKQLKNFGQRALIYISLGACGCIIILFVIIIVAIRLFRKKNKSNSMPA